MIFKGKVWKFGDNIDTDIIIPARYLNTTELKELATHCMEPLIEDFSKKVNKGDIIVAGKNFGCGSSREHAPLAIKSAGISCIIAESFARIFFRNSINMGLPVVELADASKYFNQNDEVEINLTDGIIVNLTRNEKYKIKPFPKFLQNIINSGGLLNYSLNKRKPK